MVCTILKHCLAKLLFILCLQILTNKSLFLSYEHSLILSQRTST
uniref:Uncharacterized protein n=1 Tax=Arundo donax TaxID=35708 RepID=A0A0A9A7D7_ARUDO